MSKNVKFIISNYNSNFNSTTKTWSIELPTFFTENLYQDRIIKIETFIYFKPNGSSDLGTSFHCPDLFDGDYDQMNFLIGLSGTSIEGEYILNTRKRNLEFWFCDYTDLNTKCDNTEPIETNGVYENKPIYFFIQCSLMY